MKLFVLLLSLAALLQSAFLGINICLILIVCRAFMRPNKENYYLAFGLGVAIGLLTGQNLGLWAVVYLLAVKLSHMTAKMPVSANILTVLPAAITAVMLSVLAEKFVLGQSIQYTKLAYEIILSLPVFLFVKFFEERVIASPDLKLRLKS